MHVHTERTRDGHDPMPRYLCEAAARGIRSDPPLPSADLDPGAIRDLDIG